MKRAYKIMGICSGWGAQILSCERGPEALMAGHVFEELQKLGVSIREISMLYPERRAFQGTLPKDQRLPFICDVNVRLADKMRKTLSAKEFPIVIGGDHTSGVGTWNGVEKPFGLLWIDAHMDSHTPETTPSGAYHGMPLAALLGYGARELVQLTSKKPILQPQHLALIGVRSFEEGEAALLKKLNVRIYFMEEVRRRGLKEVFSEATEYVTRGVSHYGVSLDLDAFSPEEAPGVGSPEPEGIFAKELLPCLPLMGQDSRLCAFELAEYNPERDTEHRTQNLAREILKALMQEKPC